mmetsp:Transcript_50637/g.101110  ORF Transcript_50637/g.101110 Transcript_50637/m.101110 type:complete len:118 (+) Transcript_50637:37-390(+)
MENFCCSFCHIKIYPGHGSMLVKNNLKIYFFCGSKCRKLFHLKKNPLFLRWTYSNRVRKGIQLEIGEEKNLFYKISKNAQSYNKNLVSKLLFELIREEKEVNNRKNDYKKILKYRLK